MAGKEYYLVSLIEESYRFVYTRQMSVLTKECSNTELDLYERPIRAILQF